MRRSPSTNLETVAGLSGTLLMIGMLLSVNFLTGFTLPMLCILLIFGICVSNGLLFTYALNNGRGAGFKVGGSLVICAVDGLDTGINLAIPLSIRATIAGDNLLTCGGGIDFLNTATFDLGKILRFDMIFTLVRPGTGRFDVEFVLVFDIAASAPFGRLIRCNFFAKFEPFAGFAFGRFSNIMFGFGISGGRFEYGNDNRRAMIGALRRDIE